MDSKNLLWCFGISEAFKGFAFMSESPDIVRVGSARDEKKPDVQKESADLRPSLRKFTAKMANTRDIDPETGGTWELNKDADAYFEQNPAQYALFENIFTKFVKDRIDPDYKPNQLFGRDTNRREWTDGLKFTATLFDALPAGFSDKNGGGMSSALPGAMHDFNDYLRTVEAVDGFEKSDLKALKGIIAELAGPLRTKLVQIGKNIDALSSRVAVHVVGQAKAKLDKAPKFPGEK